MIAVLIPARVSLCWNYQARGTKWSLGVNNIAFHFINFICFALHLHLTTYISSFLPSFPFKALVFCSGSQCKWLNAFSYLGTLSSIKIQSEQWIDCLTSPSGSRCCVGSWILNSPKYTKFWRWKKKIIFQYFSVEENISSLVFIKITSDKIFRRKMKFLSLG